VGAGVSSAHPGRGKEGIPTIDAGSSAERTGGSRAFDLGQLSASGGTHVVPVQIPANAALTGLAVHFQAVTADAALLALAATNVRTLTIQ
jgi:hypothetical protein